MRPGQLFMFANQFTQTQKQKGHDDREVKTQTCPPGLTGSVHPALTHSKVHYVWNMTLSQEKRFHFCLSIP